MTQENFDNFKSMIRTHLQDATKEQRRELLIEWKTQTKVSREIEAAKIKGRLKVGDTVSVDNGNTTYDVIKINRSKFVGKDLSTNLNWNVPISMIEEIL